MRGKRRSGKKRRREGRGDVCKTLKRRKRLCLWSESSTFDSRSQRCFCVRVPALIAVPTLLLKSGKYHDGWLCGPSRLIPNLWLVRLHPPSFLRAGLGTCQDQPKGKDKERRGNKSSTSFRHKRRRRRRGEEGCFPLFSLGRNDTQAGSFPPSLPPPSLLGASLLLRPFFFGDLLMATEEEEERERWERGRGECFLAGRGGGGRKPENF